MVNYSCEKCVKEFSQKSHYKKEKSKSDIIKKKQKWDSNIKAT